MKESTMPTTTYGPTTTAAEIVANVDLHGRRALVTGASSGIGVETARALASAGAKVTLAVRDLEAGRKVAEQIADTLPPGTAEVHVGRLDLADPASVVSFVRAWSGPLHILVNNAGVMARPFRADHRPTPVAGQRRRRPRGLGGLDWASVLACGVRRPALPIPPL
jgi:NAD(P)-dependent dehydrogenase (short-subunit alcohol dehydrogenase family)